MNSPAEVIQVDTGLAVYSHFRAQLAELADSNRVAAEAHAKRREQEAKEKAEREIKEQQEREADAAKKREANKQHKAKINNAAVKALVSGKISEADAKTVVTLIASSKIPNITIQY